MRDLTQRRFDVPAPRGHLSYYGLRDSPFMPIARPELLWLGTAQRTVLATLTTALHRGGGVLLLTGDIGAGKTSLANVLLAGLSGESLLIGRISDPGFESSEFFNALTEAFGISGTFDTTASFVTRFQELLNSAASNRKRVLVVVDEAHRMTPELLAEVQDLSDIGTAAGLTILLVGQEELRATLSGDRLAALRGRIAASCAVHPLTADETGRYIRHRLALAGAEDEIFSVDAIRAIASISRGAPGIINITCHAALVTGHERQVRTIRKETIEDGLILRAPPREPPDEDSREVERPPEFRRHGASGRIAYRRGGRACAGEEPSGPPRLGRSKTTRHVVVLAAFILIAGGYVLYTGGFQWSRQRSIPTTAAPGPARGAGDQDDAAVQAAPEAAAVAGANREAKTPIPSPKAERKRLSTDRAAPEPGSSAGRGISSSAAARQGNPGARGRAGSGAKIRQDVFEESPERPAVSRSPAPKRQEPGKSDEAYDPAAIIDWLLENSSPSRR
jgi:type II secretory pathway predicted ATPase ExeA